MSGISKNNKMTLVHNVCSSEANYKSQVRPKLWGVGHPNLNFCGVRTPATLTLVSPLLG